MIVTKKIFFVFEAISYWLFTAFFFVQFALGAISHCRQNMTPVHTSETGQLLFAMEQAGLFQYFDHSKTLCFFDHQMCISKIVHCQTNVEFVVWCGNPESGNFLLNQFVSEIPEIILKYSFTLVWILKKNGEETLQTESSFFCQICLVAFVNRTDKPKINLLDMKHQMFWLAGFSNYPN